MDLSFRQVIHYIRQRRPLMKKAYEDFFKETGPMPDDDDQAFSLFCEWLIFEFRLPNGATFLTEYILKDPDKLDQKTRIQFEKVVETQFYGAFEIQKVDNEGFVTAEYLVSGDSYKIYDISFSRPVPKRGTVIVRIAKIENKWFVVGIEPIYLPVTYTDRMKKMFREGKFIFYANTKETWKSMVQKNSSFSELNENMIDIEQKREVLRKTFESLAKKYNCTVSFKMIVEIIFNENRKPPLDIFKKLVDRGLPEKMFLDHFALLQDIWNYFPHKILKGKCPAEVFQEKQHEH